MVKVDLTGVKIPKQVAGVKVPKKLRKKGKKLLAKANSPEGREAIAAGLAIAGSVMAAKAQVKAARAGARAAERAAEAGAMAAERAAERAAEAGARAAAAGERVRAKVIRHPRAPGEPGIDPSHDPAAELGDAIAAGISALQRFMGNVRRD